MAESDTHQQRKVKSRRRAHFNSRENILGRGVCYNFFAFPLSLLDIGITSISDRPSRRKRGKRKANKHYLMDVVKKSGKIRGSEMVGGTKCAAIGSFFPK